MPLTQQQRDLVVKKAGYDPAEYDYDEQSNSLVLREQTQPTVTEAPPQAPSKTESFLRGARSQMGAAAAGTGGALAGMKAGAAASLLFGPAAPAALPWTTAIGGITGALGGGLLGGLIQRKAEKATGVADVWNQQLAEAQAAHPYVTFAGEMAPGLTPFGKVSPGISALGRLAKGTGTLADTPAIANMAIPAALGGGIEAGSEYWTGQDLDWGKILAAAAIQGALGEPNKFGQSLGFKPTPGRVTPEQEAAYKQWIESRPPSPKPITALPPEQVLQQLGGEIPEGASQPLPEFEPPAPRAIWRGKFSPNPEYSPMDVAGGDYTGMEAPTSLYFPETISRPQAQLPGYDVTWVPVAKPAKIKERVPVVRLKPTEKKPSNVLDLTAEPEVKPAAPPKGYPAPERPTETPVPELEQGGDPYAAQEVQGQEVIRREGREEVPMRYPPGSYRPYTSEQARQDWYGPFQTLGVTPTWRRIPGKLGASRGLAREISLSPEAAVTTGQHEAAHVWIKDRFFNGNERDRRIIRNAFKQHGLKDTSILESAEGWESPDILPAEESLVSSVATRGYARQSEPAWRRWWREAKAGWTEKLTGGTEEPQTLIAQRMAEDRPYYQRGSVSQGPVESPKFQDEQQATAEFNPRERVDTVKSLADKGLSKSAAYRYYDAWVRAGKPVPIEEFIASQGGIRRVSGGTQKIAGTQVREMPEVETLVEGKWKPTDEGNIAKKSAELAIKQSGSSEDPDALVSDLMYEWTQYRGDLTFDKWAPGAAKNILQRERRRVGRTAPLEVPQGEEGEPGILPAAEQTEVPEVIPVEERTAAWRSYFEGQGRSEGEVERLMREEVPGFTQMPPEIFRGSKVEPKPFSIPANEWLQSARALETDSRIVKWLERQVVSAQRKFGERAPVREVTRQDLLNARHLIAPDMPYQEFRSFVVKALHKAVQFRKKQRGTEFKDTFKGTPAGRSELPTKMERLPTETGRPITPMEELLLRKPTAGAVEPEQPARHEAPFTQVTPEEPRTATGQLLKSKREKLISLRQMVRRMEDELDEGPTRWEKGNEIPDPEAAKQIQSSLDELRPRLTKLEQEIEALAAQEYEVEAPMAGEVGSTIKPKGESTLPTREEVTEGWKYSSAPDPVEEPRRTFSIPFLESTVSKVRKVSKELGEGAQRFFDRQSRLQGEFVNFPEELLSKYPRSVIKSTWDKHREAYRTGGSPSLTPEEQDVSRLLSNHFLSVRRMQNEVGLKIHGREGGENQYYVPDEMSIQAIDTLANKPNSPEAIALKEEWTRYLVDQGLPEEEATKLVANYQSALSADPHNYKAIYFGALREAAGYGLPESMREQDPMRALRRYGNRAARDLAFYTELQKPHAALLGIEPEEGAPAERSSLSAEPAVRELMHQIIKGNQRTIGSARIAAVIRTVSNAILGPGTGLRDLVSIPVNSLPYVQGDLGVFARAARSVRKERLAALRTNAYRKGLDVLMWGDQEVPDRFTDLMNKFAQLLRVGQGREHLERFNRAYTFALGKELARTKYLKHDAQFFKRFGSLVEGDIFAKSGQELEDAFDQVAKNFVDAVQGTYDPRGLPAFNPAIEPWFNLSKWSIEKTNTILRDVVNPALNGNYKPLIAYTIGALGTGVGIRELNELLSNKKAQDPSLKEAMVGGGTKDQVAAVVSLMQLANYGGILADAVKLASDTVLRGVTPRAPISFPAVQFLEDQLAEGVINYREAVAQGEDPFKSAMILLGRTVENTVQAWRYAANNTYKSTEAERLDKFRDFRVYKELQGQVLPSRTERTNPALNADIREFKRESDPRKAAALLPRIFATIKARHAGDPEAMMNAIEGLKKNSYQTMPSPERMPYEAQKYYQYLVKAYGEDEAQARVKDYFQQKLANQIKGSLVP